MTPDPEPDGTRMQVVKGFEALTFDLVEPALGPVYAFDSKTGRPTRTLRETILARWPKWDGRTRCWRCSYTRTDFDGGETHCRIRLAPSGRASLICYDRDGGIVVAEEADLVGFADGDRPVESMFHALNGTWGVRIAAHVAAMAKRE